MPSNDPNHPDWVPSVFKHTENKGVQWKAITRYERNLNRRKIHHGSETGDFEEISCRSSDARTSQMSNVTALSDQDDCAMNVDVDPVGLDGAPQSESLPDVIHILNDEGSVALENAVQRHGELVLNSNCSVDLERQLEEALKQIKEQDEKIHRLEALLGEALNSAAEQNKQFTLDKKLYADRIETLELQKRCLEMKMSGINHIGFSPVKLCSDDEVRFFTGFPNAKLFKEFVAYVSTRHNVTTSCSLSAENGMLLTLMKLRLGLKNQDLAYRFQCARTSVSKVFHVWLDALSVECKKLIIWPDRKTLRKHLPSMFRNPTFRDTVVIIDCTEVFIERPSSLSARSQTYSNYKNHNTMKFLVGVTPAGAISFLSKCYGGRISDKQITIESGILDKLEPGDLVLADRGFFISELVALKQAKLYIPAFTRGKKQLSAEEVEVSRSISNVRIHVERAIGRLKNFNILKNCLSVNLLKQKRGDASGMSTADKILVVCAGIVNMGPPLIKE